MDQPGKRGSFDEPRVFKKKVAIQESLEETGEMPTTTLEDLHQTFMACRDKIEHFPDIARTLLSICRIQIPQ